MRPGWFPRWDGETCMIVASGPSAKQVDLERARGRCRVIAINESWRLVPWADILYACDHGFWEAKQGLKEFHGLKVSQDAISCTKFPDVRRIVCDRKSEDIVFDKLGTVGWGGNSGFHALNLAIQFGCRKIVLVGYDMRLDRGLHWHGAHQKGVMNNPTEGNVERWRRTIDNNAKAIAARGIEVINCSPVSRLVNYPKMSLTDALDLPKPSGSKILAIGREIRSPSDICDFGGVFSYYVTRELRRRGFELTFMPRPHPDNVASAFRMLDVESYDHILAFGSRYFSRLPANIADDLSRRIKGAVCQFHDASMPPNRNPNADLTFACKGEQDRHNRIIGWAADPEVCKPNRETSTLGILVDHADYDDERPDLTAETFRQIEKLKESGLVTGKFSRVTVEQLESPKDGRTRSKPFAEHCAAYGRAHLFMVTHREGVGLSAIEAATAGALVIAPRGFIDRKLLGTIRHIEYEGDIPWPLVVKKIMPQASRDRASLQTWGAVADRIVAGLKEFHK